MKAEVFGGEFILGAYEVALAHALAAIAIEPTMQSDRGQQIAKAMANGPRAVDGRRVWWRVQQDIAKPPAYISIAPGEHRDEPPTGPKDLIMELPDLDEYPTLTATVSQLVEDVKQAVSQGLLAPGSNAGLLATAARLLCGDPSKAFPGRSDFRQAAVQLRKGAVTLEGVCQRLFDSVLFSHRLPIVSFSLEMLLLQLQAMTALWIDGHAEMDPVELLPHLVRRAMRVSATAVQLQLRRVGLGNYQAGANRLRQAQTALTYPACLIHTQLAIHHYWTASMLCKIRSDLDLKMTLEYGAIPAEEGFACSRSGLPSEGNSAEDRIGTAITRSE
jgi:hypothetical protein